ncbi:TBC domain-containing protein [Toxoplasma gondii ARI]|uniref:TBC domain-containing protein n=1 Tax=Toxoplasma gondii ARI TaxID=1074872 RepID=A0A139XXX6_TOXGO|nr:TBC domain-containing protein [Toxoplasma gondii ARI]
MFSSSSAFSRDPFVAFAPMTHTEAQSETVGDSVGKKAEGAGPVLTRPRSLSSLSATVSTVSVSSPPSTSSHSRQISGSLGLGAQPSPDAAPSGVQTESRSRLRVCSPTVCPVAPHIVSAVSFEGYGGVSVSSAERRAAPHCASASAEEGHEGPLLSGVAGACAGREDAQSLSSSPSCTCKSCACCGEGLLYGGDKETRRLRRRVWLLALGRLDRLGLQIARELQWETASLAAGSLACDASRKAQAQQVRAATQDAKRRQRLGKTQTADEEGGGEEEEQLEENEREDDDEQEEIQIAGGVATEGEEARRREGRARGELEGGASCCEYDGDSELPGPRLHCGRGTKETRERKRLASSGGRDAGRLPSSQAAREAIAALYPRAFMPNVCFDLSGPLSIARGQELQQFSSERRRPFRFSSFGAEASPCGAGEEKRTTAPLPGEEEEDEPLLPWPCREIFAFLLECRLDEARADEIRRDVPRTFPRHP